VFIVHTCKEEEEKEEEAAKKNLVLRSQYFLPQTLFSLSLSLSHKISYHITTQPKLAKEYKTP
jgi:hypothetical protein